MKLHARRPLWVPLVVAAFVLGSCGLSAFNEFEARDEARGAIRRGDSERLAQLVNEHSGLRSADAQLLFLASTGCHPEMARFMIDELDFRADIERDGWGVLNTILAPSPGEEELPNTEEECSTEDLVRTLRVLLAAGASPCLSHDGDDSSRPLVAAEAWGYSEAVTDELNSHGFSC
jgi:hypothetical protein